MDVIGTYTPDNFLAGNFPIERVAAVAGTGGVKRHAPVKCDTDGTIIPVVFIDGTAAIPPTEDPFNPGAPATTAEGNTSAGLYGIAAEAAEEGAETVVYLTGDFFAAALEFETDVTADLIKGAFRAISIFLK
ncbi:hypothetical protein FACS1894217_04820 [Clostridia bacterium]|nr:hypothetical protein FACS1894217_04820 [Clostridia bacterium]